MLYNMGLSPQTFLLYLITDCSDTSNPTRDVTFLAFSAQIAGLLATIPTGKLTDRFGRKIFVYILTFRLILTFV